MSTVAALIAEGSRALGLPDDAERVATSLLFLELLSRWNRVTNLTAITEQRDMVAVHLLDSWAITSYLKGTSIIDVGSGAGLPGIPLAMINPHKSFLLLDVNGKKTRFMTQAVLSLKLDNVHIVQARAQDYRGEFAHVVCRAFGSLNRIADAVAHLLTTDGTVLAMKGPKAEAFKSDKLHIMGTEDIAVPSLKRERRLLLLGKKDVGEKAARKKRR